MTDASAGLTRCSICFKTEACNLRTCPLKPSTDALLADLRGKLEEQADAYRQNIEAMRSTRDGIQRELMSVTTQLEAERAKVREATELLQEAYDYGAMWRGERICKWVVEDDQLPASVDAKGENGNG
jgi:hypothetical protein